MASLSHQTYLSAWCGKRIKWFCSNCFTRHLSPLSHGNPASREPQHGLASCFSSSSSLPRDFQRGIFSKPTTMLTASRCIPVSSSINTPPNKVNLTHSTGEQGALWRLRGKIASTCCERSRHLLTSLLRTDSNARALSTLPGSVLSALR